MNKAAKNSNTAIRVTVPLIHVFALGLLVRVRTYIDQSMFVQER